MITPKKHISLYESLMGLSVFIYSRLIKKVSTVDELWTSYQKINNSKKFPAKHGFDNFILAIDILFSLKRIKLNNRGKLENEVN